MMKQVTYTNDIDKDNLLKVALALHQTLDIKVTLETLLDYLEKSIPFDSASIMLLDDEGFLIIQATRGYDQWLPEANQFKGVAFPVNKASLPIYKIYQSQESILISDVRQEQGWQPDIAAGAIIRNWIGVPLLVGGRFIGLMSIDKMEPGVFNKDHLTLAEQIATHAALAIQNARLFQAEQTRAQKLQQSQAILFRAEKAAALSRLTTAISHQINNPVQAIQGCLSLTREEIENPDNEDINLYLNIIEDEAKRITTIVNNMRGSHPNETDKSRQPCDINALLDTIIRKNEKLFNAKKIKLQRKWGKNLPLIQANEQTLAQAFQNIIHNAIEVLNHNEQLLLETTISQTPDAQNPAIQVTIHNAGKPIPENIQEKLFEPFITTKDKQFGLGLFVSYSIIEAHGGQITATSTAEQGTIFTIHLPVPPNSQTQ